jgi:hypothetical protein
MEYIKRKLFCTFLNREVNTVFYFNNVQNTSGDVKKKYVEYYDCEGKAECYEKVELTKCTCFKELARVEQEINGFLSVPIK